MPSDLAATGQRLHVAMAAYELAGLNTDPGELRGAAQAHISVSRPLAVVQAEYKASLEHPEPDLVAQQNLADELQPLRQAHSILEGQYPGMGMTVSTEG
jgi:hypothetical protein